jgi:hypothetical protein
MAHVLKTVGPLHFEDLEPHRFEDLVRQLVYDLKDWKAIEATGRSGSDEGFDIRAWESISVEEELQEDDEEESLIAKAEGRLWLIQCKREKSITPKKLKKYAEDINVSPCQPIYGVIFAAACDFSKRSRDTFIDVIRQKGIQEFHLWGKAELEDMLFQPKNDHLLFAYFGFSLSIRRRSLKTKIRSKLSIKRKLVGYFGLNVNRYQDVLIRDSHDTSYPYKDRVKDFDKNPKWWPYVFRGYYYDGIKLLTGRFFAYLADDQVHWDHVPDVDDTYSMQNPWQNEKGSKRFEEKRNRVLSYWRKIPEQNQVWYEIIEVIPYERIIDVDKDGDEWLPQCPHIYVECTRTGEFFENKYQRVLARTMYGALGEIYSPKIEDRVEYFPKRFPNPKKRQGKLKNLPE